MAKLTLSDIAAGYASPTRINANNDAVEAALENTLSRDGTDPNNMESDLDMDSHRVINLGSPVNSTDAARWVDVTDSVNLTGQAVPALTGNSQKYLGTDGSSLGWKNFFDLSSAESTAGVTPTNYQYTWGDIRRYGAIGDGATDNATALSNAVAAAAVLGGEIYIPPGAFNFSSFPSLASKQSLIFTGEAGANSGAAKASRLIYTGTGTGAVVNMSAAQAITFKQLQILHSNAGFTGTYFSTGGAAYMIILEDCFLGANVGAGVTHLNLDAMTNFHAIRCTFFHGNPSVKGQLSTGGSYSNVVSFRDCEWYYQVVAPIVWPGESWTFDNCVFEALVNGKAAAIDYGSSSTPCKGLTLNGCWLGDVTASGGTWLSLYGAAISISGTRFGGYATSTYAITLDGCQGVSIDGNTFDTFSGGINFGAVGTQAGISITNNNFLSVSSILVNASNAPSTLVVNPNYPRLAVPSAIGTAIATTPGWELSPNGIIRQWGMITALTVGTPQTVTFPKQFPNGLHAVSLAVSGPTSGADVAYITSPGVTGFTGNLNGTAGHSCNLYWQSVGY